MSVFEKLAAIEWWTDNILLYGCERNHMYNIVIELIKHKNNGKMPHISVEHVNSNNSMIRVSPLHHEFDFAISYNSATTNELIERVTQLSSFRRIQGNKHIIFLHNMDVLTSVQINRFKSTVQNYCDRTCFIITTTKLAKMPFSIQYSCTLVRCSLADRSTYAAKVPPEAPRDISDTLKNTCVITKCDDSQVHRESQEQRSDISDTLKNTCVITKCDDSHVHHDESQEQRSDISGTLTNCLHKKLSPVLEYMMLNCRSLSDDKQAVLLVALKDFAYTCIGYNVRFAYVAKTIVDVLIDLKACNQVLQSVLEILASCEASSYGMKKDIVAWELAFIKIVAIFKRQ